MAIYKGYSTLGGTKNTLTVDTDLIKADLLNHLNTRMGERLHRPDFGCKIWSLIHSPLDDVTIEAIVDDLTRIIETDPRLLLSGIEVNAFEHGVQCLVELEFQRLSSSEALFIQFNRDTGTIVSATIDQ